MEKVSISSGDRQSPSDHNGTANLLNGLNFPTPTRGTMVKVPSNGAPRAVGQGRRALLSGLEVARPCGFSTTLSNPISIRQILLGLAMMRGAVLVLPLDLECHWYFSLYQIDPSSRI